MIKSTTYNFTNIRNVIEAAELLQEAGKDDDIKKILSELANELLEK